MPRPKPPEKLTERCIRLTDNQWAELQRRGGAQWLRNELGAHYSIAQYRKDKASNEPETQLRSMAS